jgi:hypothetical protein
VTTTAARDDDRGARDDDHQELLGGGPAEFDTASCFPCDARLQCAAHW